MPSAEIKVSEDTTSDMKTKPWFLTWDYDGEQHMISLPYRKYAYLFELALSRVSIEEIRGVMHSA
jgi:hypothetical protein